MACRCCPRAGPGKFVGDTIREPRDQEVGTIVGSTGAGIGASLLAHVLKKTADHARISIAQSILLGFWVFCFGLS